MQIVALSQKPCRSMQWPPYCSQGCRAIVPCCYMRRHSAGLSQGPCRSMQWPLYCSQGCRAIVPCYNKRRHLGSHLKSLVVACNGLAVVSYGS